MDAKEFFESNYARTDIHLESPCLFMVDFQEGAFMHSADGMAGGVTAPCMSVLSLFRRLCLPVVHFWLNEGEWFQRNDFRRSYVEPYVSSNRIQIPFKAAEGELVIEKPDRSCFFHTDIEHFLLQEGVQDIVLMGTTTSGCIRSTVSDGDMRGYNMILPDECIWDQSREVHDANMFDMKHKYAVVMGHEELERKITSLMLLSKSCSRKIIPWLKFGQVGLLLLTL